MTAGEVAAWMCDRLLAAGALYQHEVVEYLDTTARREHLRENDAGRLAIAKPVLEAFKRLTIDVAVWDRGERAWRKRSAGDSTGRIADQ